MHPSRDNADPLFMVFDTNAFLAPPNVYHENRTGDSRTALEMLRSFTADDRGTLPPISVRIPWIVRQELIGLSDKYDRSGDWIASIPGRAAMAVFYINEVSKDRSGLISYQSKPEHQEARAVQRIPEDKDELVLLCSLQVKKYDSENVWLITNDVRLSARAARSGIISLNFCGLKHALTLNNGTDATLGDTFIEKRVFEGLSVLGELTNLRSLEAQGVDGTFQQNNLLDCTPPGSSSRQEGAGPNGHRAKGDGTETAARLNDPRPCVDKENSGIASSSTAGTSEGRSSVDQFGMMPERDDAADKAAFFSRRFRKTGSASYVRSPSSPPHATIRDIRDSLRSTGNDRSSWTGQRLCSDNLSERTDVTLTSSPVTAPNPSNVMPVQGENPVKTSTTTGAVKSLQLAGLVGATPPSEIEEDDIMITEVISAPLVHSSSASESSDFLIVHEKSRKPETVAQNNMMNGTSKKRIRPSSDNDSPEYERGFPNYEWQLGRLQVRQELANPIPIPNEWWSPFPVSRFH